MLQQRVKLAKIKYLVVFLLLLGLVGSSLSPVWAGEPNMQEIKRLLDMYYVKQVDWSKLTDKDLEELLEALGDPYTSYLTPAQFDSLTTSLSGSFGGVGIHIENVEGFVTVISPIKDTPAYEAGLLPQDRIIFVDNFNVVGVPMEQVLTLIRGEPGTRVTLRVLRGQERLTFELTRQLIRVDSVRQELLEGDIGYIRIITFGQGTVQEVREALTDLDRQGARGYILDLRFNGGGYLDAALELAELFIPAGPIVHVVDRTNRQWVYRASGRNLFNFVNPATANPQVGSLAPRPLAVLINEGSASASEIFAAAIRDNGQGVLVGTPSFGKASVQTLLEVSGGGVLKVTTAYYLTPLRENINGVGLTPQLIVESYDDQLPKAGELIREWLDKRPQGQRKSISLFIQQPYALVNGQRVALDGVPFLENGRAYVPLRFVSQELGMQVHWLQSVGKIKVTKGNQVAVFTPGSHVALLPNRQVVFDAPVLIRDNRSYIPIRLLLDIFGGQVEWLGEKGELRIDYLLLNE